jgi:nucleoside-diphosphate-sugar epimerase
VVINPAFILGPSLITTDFTSGQVIKLIMTGKYPGMPKIQMPIVDVRDTAFAHLQAVKVAAAKNQRFILCSGSLWFKEYAVTLKEAYPDYKFSTKELGFCPVKVASWFDGTVKQLIPFWNRSQTADNTRSKAVLSIQYVSPKESILAMA